MFSVIGTFLAGTDEDVRKTRVDPSVFDVIRSKQNGLCRSLSVMGSFSDLFVSRSDFEQKTGTMLFLGRKIGKGAFGSAIETELVEADGRRKKIVVKRMDYKGEWNTERREKREGVERELFAHATLFCGSNTDLVVEPFFSLLDSTPSSDRYLIGMDRLDTTLYSFFNNSKMSTGSRRDSLFVKAILDVSTGLLELQQRFQFVHGDMHANNVMVRYGPNSMLKEPTFHLIDFGLSMLNFSLNPNLVDLTTEVIDLLSDEEEEEEGGVGSGLGEASGSRVGGKVNEGRLSVGAYGYRGEKEIVFNPSHDLLQLLLSFFDARTSRNRFGIEVDTAIYEVYSDIFDRKQEYPVLYERMNGHMMKRYEHPFYWETISVLYPPSTPRSIIRTFEEANRKLEGKKTQGKKRKA